MRTKYLLATIIATFTFIGILKSQTPNKAYADSLLADRVADTIVVFPDANGKTITMGYDKNGKFVVKERGKEGKIKEIIYYSRKSERRKNRIFRRELMFDIGFNTYSEKNHFTGSKGDSEFLDLHTSKSVNVALYPIYGSFRLTKSRLLELQTGIGIDWGNYRFEDGWTITKENGKITGVPPAYLPNGKSLLSKSKLVTVYLNVPLMMRLNIPIGGSYRNSFYLSAGVIGGLKIGSHTKIKYSDGGKKEKDRGSFNLNLAKYDLTFRAGYRNIGLYFNYQMTPMFEKNKGPELYPYTVGFSFTI